MLEMLLPQPPKGWNLEHESTYLSTKSKWEFSDGQSMNSDPKHSSGPELPCTSVFLSVCLAGCFACLCLLERIASFCLSSQLRLSPVLLPAAAPTPASYPVFQERESTWLSLTTSALLPLSLRMTRSTVTYIIL